MISLVQLLVHSRVFLRHTLEMFHRTQTAQAIQLLNNYGSDEQLERKARANHVKRR